MGYLYLTLALIGGLGKGFLGKNISNDINNFKDCILMNLLRMLFGTLVAGVVIWYSNEFGALGLSSDSLLICILSAVSMSAFAVSWMYAYKTEAYMFLSIFTMLGTVITCLLSYIFLGEAIRLNQWAGMLLIGIAIYIMSKHNKAVSGALTPKGIAILLIGCSGSAVADFCQKLCRLKTTTSGSVFNFYTYAFSVVLLLAIFSFIPKNNQPKSTFVDAKHITICALISGFLYLNTFSKTLATGFLSSAQIYPVLQGANLICSALLARILLKEKITLKSVCGMVVAFSALLIMQLL